MGTEENKVFSSHSLVAFDHCRIDKPELLTFNTVVLRPSWFINTDVRKVDFTDVDWYRLLYESKSFKHIIRSLKERVQVASETLKQQLHKTEDEAELLQKPETKSTPDNKSYRHHLERLRFYGSSLAQAWHRLTATALDDEVEALRARDVRSPYTLLAQACQRLAANAEENRNHAHASGFNYWAMDAQRKGKRASAFAPWRLIWWYWALSGYGERTWRSAIWLVGILIGFAVLYMLPFVGSEVRAQELSLPAIWQAFPEAVVYSLGVMSRQAARLAGSDPTLLRALVFLEGILGPLQVALFALALRRRFMRGKG